MTKGKARPHSNAVREILELLQAYREGNRLAYLTPGTRLDRELPPMRSQSDEELARALLDAAQDESQVVALAHRVGSRHALAVLRQVLHPPSRPGFVLARLYPCALRFGDRTTWMLHEVDLSAMALQLHTLLWIDFSVGTESPGDARNPANPEVVKEPEFFRLPSVQDNAGKSYEWSGSSAHVSYERIFGDQGPITRLVMRYSQNWFPGPSRAVSTLVVTPPRSVQVRRNGFDGPDGEVRIDGRPVVFGLPNWWQDRLNRLLV